MATIKSFTDISQSKKLAEFLSHESADQTWERIAIAGANLDVQDELQYKHNGNMPFSYYSGIGVPCWSLAALLNTIPAAWKASLERCSNGTFLVHLDDMEEYDCYANNPVDACVEMIIKLKTLNLL